MPEGDTVWLAAKRLHATLAGQRLDQAELRVPEYATTVLAGATVTAVVAVGKHLLIRLDDGRTLHTHLRMDGSWHITAAGARWPVPAHEVRVVLGTARHQVVGRRIHDITVLPTAEEDRLVGHLGPDLLGPDWDAGEALRRLRADGTRPVGEALLDQRNLAGIGNMYENEVLFIGGRSPWTPVADVADLEAIVERARRLLWANRDHPEQSTTGSTRRGDSHWVYDRAGLPCRRCRTPIRRGRLGTVPADRVAFWCPRCQPGPSPDPTVR